MALFVPGIAVGQISGRVGGSIFSHNRGGQYIRNGTIPVNPITPARQQIKAWFSEASIHWTTLAIADQEAWNGFAALRSWTNRIGRSIKLNGQQWCIQLNARILGVGGTKIDVPPLTDSPDPIAGAALVADIGSGDFELSWTSGALASGVKLYLRGCVLEGNTPGYVKNKLREFMVSSGAATTPLDLSTTFPARFGTLQVGQIALVECRTIDSASGLQSIPFNIGCPITDTP
jgi:hypothetical protein